jgi:hypothetical protein
MSEDIIDGIFTTLLALSAFIPFYLLQSLIEPYWRSEKWFHALPYMPLVIIFILFAIRYGIESALPPVGVLIVFVGFPHLLAVFAHHKNSRK